MKYLFALLLFFFSFLSFGQTPCLDAVANSTGLIGEFIPQCEDDGSYSSMQCWSSTGYCWCVDENGIEISGTSLGPGQGTPDCGGGVDCVDDPDGILEGWSYQCNDIVGSWFSWGCDDDVSLAVPWASSGMWTIGDLCPQSCYECEETDCEQDLDSDGICEDDCEEIVTIIEDCECSFFDPNTYTVYYTTVDEESCTLIETCYCECINDVNNNGICDEEEQSAGCTDPGACNYDASILPGDFDDGSCEYPGDLCEGFDFQLQELVYGILDDDCECGLPLSIDMFLGNKEIINTVNLLGHKSEIDSKEKILIYIYDDGSIEKKYILK